MFHPMCVFGIDLAFEKRKRYFTNTDKFNVPLINVNILYELNFDENICSTICESKNKLIYKNKYKFMVYCLFEHI